mmetsp:Transcript_7157/g.20972  ORF Transcript_7157/g.20972 Transcript_7157/m.20972 type:complete len:293 (-) Transcript_7157:1178-2056(-)
MTPMATPSCWAAPNSLHSSLVKGRRSKGRWLTKGTGGTQCRTASPRRASSPLRCRWQGSPGPRPMRAPAPRQGPLQTSAWSLTPRPASLPGSLPSCESLGSTGLGTGSRPVRGSLLFQRRPTALAHSPLRWWTTQMALQPCTTMPRWPASTRWRCGVREMTRLWAGPCYQSRWHRPPSQCLVAGRCCGGRRRRGGARRARRWRSRCSCTTSTATPPRRATWRWQWRPLGLPASPSTRPPISCSGPCRPLPDRILFESLQVATTSLVGPSLCMLRRRCQTPRSAGFLGHPSRV